MNEILLSIADGIAGTVTIPQPPPPVAPPFGAPLLETIAGLQWTAFVLAIVGLIIAGIRMVLGIRQGEGAAHLGVLGWTFAGIFVVATPVSIIGFIVNGAA